MSGTNQFNSVAEYSELNEYKKGKGSVRFPLDQPLPKDLIIRMIQYRAELLKK